MSEYVDTIAIVGAGIGGLVTAHALRRAGLKVRVFERAPHLRATGAGISLQPNALVALESMDCAARIIDAGYPLEKGTIETWKGDVISAFDLGNVADELGFAAVAIHRGLLVDELGKDLDEVLVFDACVEAVRNDEDAAIVEFDDGRRMKFGGVVGCDGLHSAVRRSLFGEQELRYAGYTTWRGITDISAEEAGAAEYWGRGRRFGSTPIAEDEVYWFAVDEAPEGKTPSGSMIDDVAHRFQGWNQQVQRLLDHVVEETVLRTDTYDRAPIDEWGRGRITLLGDAAHPMTPNLGQGGSQAIEDAVVLGRILAEHDNIEEGFRRYESLRIDRANDFVTQSLQLGQIAQWKNPVARAIRDAGLRLVPQSMTERHFAKSNDFEGWYQSAVQ